MTQVIVALSTAAAVVWLFSPSRPERRGAGAAPVPEPRPIQISEIQVEPPPAPEREPDPVREERPAEPARAASPAPAARAEADLPPPLATLVEPDAAVVARGAALMQAGTFPRLRATYDRIGFADYRDAMLALGGRFFLFDPRARRPVAEVEPITGAVRGRSLPAGLSPWPRDVTRHLPSVLALGRERFGERVARVVLLPPASVDAALLGALDLGLRDAGLRPEDALRVDVAYELRGGRLHCEVLRLALRDGSERALPLRIDLARGGSTS